MYNRVTQKDGKSPHKEIHFPRNNIALRSSVPKIEKPLRISGKLIVYQNLYAFNNT